MDHAKREIIAHYHAGSFFEKNNNISQYKYFITFKT